MHIFDKFISRSIILCFSILICVFVLDHLILVYASQTIPGIQRLEEGIAAYEHGEYDDAIFKFEMAVYQIGADDKDKLWDAHFYLGLSYFLSGDNDVAKEQFIKAQGIISNRAPDVFVHSPKVVKLFKVATNLLVPFIEMVFVKGGCYEMGDDFEDPDKIEKPVHEVCVDNFYIGKYEVTQGLWEEVMGNNPSQFESGEDYPVQYVSWDNVQKFINKLNNMTGKNYRLPTEAEWEYAARSGGKRERFSGFSNENEMYKYANFCDSNCTSSCRIKSQNDGYKNTSPFGSYKPNELGIYDMAGNVWEWCQDWFDGNYYSNSLKNNPKGPSSGSYRVIRGGSWLNEPRGLRASNRGCYYPDYRGSHLGFRLVREPHKALSAQGALKGKQAQSKAVQPKKVKTSVISKIKLRSTPKRRLSEKSVKAMLKDKGFYDEFKNNSVSGFRNDYRLQNGGKVVYDRASGLMWQRSDSYETIHCDKVKEYVAQLNSDRFAGYNDWRLPTLEEAMSLIESSEQNGVHVDAVFTVSAKYGSTTWTSDLNSNYRKAWIVYFGLGACNNYYYIDLSYHVRLVRSIKEKKNTVKKLFKGLFK
jgi:formylglycine-generating enzyme